MAQGLACRTWTVVVRNHYEYTTTFVICILFGVTLSENKKRSTGRRLVTKEKRSEISINIKVDISFLFFLIFSDV